jgi:hypothetical protein
MIFIKVNISIDYGIPDHQKIGDYCSYTIYELQARIEITHKKVGR